LHIPLRTKSVFFPFSSRFISEKYTPFHFYSIFFSPAQLAHKKENKEHYLRSQHFFYLFFSLGV